MDRWGAGMVMISWRIGFEVLDWIIDEVRLD